MKDSFCVYLFIYGGVMLNYAYRFLIAPFWNLKYTFTDSG
jgi:hypothetical protein